MIEVMGRRRRRKHLLDDRTAARMYWKLKEEALDRNVWRNRFGRGYGSCLKTDCRMMTEVQAEISSVTP